LKYSHPRRQNQTENTNSFCHGEFPFVNSVQPYLLPSSESLDGADKAVFPPKTVSRDEVLING
jgi:hypothetical protein